VHPVYGCGLRYKDPGGDWVSFISGLNVDESNGWGWYAPTDFQPNAQAITACSSATVGGLTGFALPNINQVRHLAGGCPATVEGGSCRIKDSSCLTKACGTDSLCSSCIGGVGGYCRANVQICNRNFPTKSKCSDCGTDNVWMYGVSNGNFLAVSPTSSYSYACVRTNVPNY
jgi:hypothetical protein